MNSVRIIIKHSFTDEQIAYPHRNLKVEDGRVSMGKKDRRHKSRSDRYKPPINYSSSKVSMEKKRKGSQTLPFGTAIRRGI